MDKDIQHGSEHGNRGVHEHEHGHGYDMATGMDMDIDMDNHSRYNMYTLNIEPPLPPNSNNSIDFSSQIPLSQKL
jgi:hypothetical protein